MSLVSRTPIVTYHKVLIFWGYARATVGITWLQHMKHEAETLITTTECVHHLPLGSTLPRLSDR